MGVWWMILSYFKDFMKVLLGESLSTCVVAELLTVGLSICILYLFTKLVFPKDSVVKKVVFIFLFVFAFLSVLYSNGITLLTITQLSPSLGVTV